MLLNTVHILLRLKQLHVGYSNLHEKHCGLKEKKRNSSFSDSHCGYSYSSDKDFGCFSPCNTHCRATQTPVTSTGATSTSTIGTVTTQILMTKICSNSSSSNCSYFYPLDKRCSHSNPSSKYGGYSIFVGKHCSLFSSCDQYLQLLKPQQQA